MNADKKRAGGRWAFSWRVPLSAFICVYLWLIAVPVPAAEPLGRLFFTPDQRGSLDTARSKKTRVNLTTETPDEKPAAAAPLPEVVTYGGLVRRSDGKATVWINDRAVQDKDMRAGAVVGKVRPDGSVTVQSPQSGRSVDLKVGQRAELLSGTVEEGYSSRGAAAAKPEARQETKPAAKPETEASAKEVRDREERDRRRDVEDAVRAMRDAADSAKPAAAPAPPSQAPSR